MNKVQRATFGGEYIEKVENIERPVVTVNRTGKRLATGETDLIVCGNCGAVMSYKAKFCMGCGAKFSKINSVDVYKRYEEEVKAASNTGTQLNFMEGQA